MSGIALHILNNYLEVETNSDLQAVSGSTLTTGQLASSDESGFYQFDNTVLNIGQNDILLSDNSGIWRQYTGPFIPVNDIGQITNLASISNADYIVWQSSTSGTTTGTTLTISDDNAVIGDLIFTQLVSSTNSCFLFNASTVTITGQFTVTFNTTPGTYNFSYLFIRANQPLATGLTYPIVAFTDFQQVQTYTNAAALKAITTNPQSGILGYATTGSLYYFDTNVLNIGTNDLVLNNNAGTWRYYTNPYIYVDDNNMVSNANLIPGQVVASGTATGTSVTTSATISNSDISAGDLVFIQWIIIPTNSTNKVTSANGSFTITTSQTLSNYSLNYIVFSPST